MTGVKSEAITAEKMAEIDKKAVEFGIPRLLLMENAGGAVARTIMEKFNHGLKIIVFAGTGNNGGDGFVAARHLANKGAKVNVFLIGNPEDIRTEETCLNWDVIRKMRRNIKIHVVRSLSDLKKRERYLKRADVFIDAMLGTGLRGSLREPFFSIVRLINESGIPVVSVDAPTGLNPSTGEVHGLAVKATYTVTFHKMKRGFLEAKEYTGEIIVADIGIPKEVEAAAIGEHRSSRRRTSGVSGQATRLVSACLLGVNCRYDGQNELNEKVTRLAAQEVLIPVCPEQLGGLGTPRESMGIIGGGGSEVLDGKARVVDRSGKDVTENLVRGAEEVLKIAKSLGVKDAILKAKSPSCGCGKIHSGAFSDMLVKGNGVTAELLKRNGIHVITEDNL
ncbi:NAD(P)H-hydrate epimerase [subsurface metagenome]|nr:MAG: NAD(P)H-hydrate epimerase [Hadesarchaea archaeon]